jgi:guanine nucleotide-binding protein subunit alpha
LKNFQLLFTPKAFELEVGKLLLRLRDPSTYVVLCFQAEMWRPIIQLNLVRSVNFIISFISDQGLYDAGPHYQSRPSSPLLTPKIRTLCLRLGPLRSVEEDIVRILSRRSSQKPHKSVHFLDNTVTNGPLRFRSSKSAPSDNDSDKQDYSRSRRVLDALGEDIAALWRDESLQQALKLAEVDLKEQPGL